MDRIESDQLRKLGGIAPNGLAKVAIDGTFLWVNPGYERITGYTSAELLKLRWQDITPPHDRDLDQQMVNAIVDGSRREYEMIKSYNRKNNGLVIVHIVVSGWYDDAGKLTHFLVVATPKDPRTIVATSTDKRAVTISTKGRVSFVKDLRWVLMSAFLAVSTTVGWLVTVNTAVGDVKRNTASIVEMQKSIAEILRRLPAKE